MGIQSAKAARFKTYDGAMKRMCFENAIDESIARRLGRPIPQPWRIVVIDTGNSSHKQYRLERQPEETTNG